MVGDVSAAVPVSVLAAAAEGLAPMPQNEEAAAMATFQAQFRAAKATEAAQALSRL